MTLIMAKTGQNLPGTLSTLYFLRNNSATPDHITDVDQSNQYVREVSEREIFPQAEFANLTQTTLSTFNLSYFPSERGPYNFDVLATPYSSGIDNDGKLLNPSSRWGGIMRDIQTIDFESANIEFIEFWLMDPFDDNVNSENSNPPPPDAGYLYINLGNVSEDVLKDSRIFFENGLPKDGGDDDLDATTWGNVPRIQPIVNAFDVEITSRINQDKGFDGLDNAQEADRYADYLTALQSAVNAAAFDTLSQDPANDDYHFFRGDDYDADRVGIISRYKKFNNPQGNSPHRRVPEQTFQVLPPTCLIQKISIMTSPSTNRNPITSTGSGYRPIWTRPILILMIS